MSVRLNPEQAYLGYFENAIERRLPAVYASGGELLSELARKRIEASLWRELSRLVGAHLERARNDLITRRNPFAAIDPALFTSKQRLDGAARLLEEMTRGSYAIPAGMEDAVEERHDPDAHAHGEMLGRLREHREGICDLLFEGRPYETIEDLSLGAGDLHRGGRSVCLVKTDRGTLVYKPRSCLVDTRASSFVERYFPRSIIIPRCYAAEGFGVCEFLQKRRAEGEREARSWYRALGEATVLFHILGSQDMTAENVVSVDGRPALIDLETLLAPLGPVAPPCGNPHFDDAVMSSAWTSGVVPRTVKDVQLSVLFNGDERRSSLPVVNGAPATVLDFWPDFEQGLDEAYERCLGTREGLVQDVQTLFGDVPLRCVLRDSQAYACSLEYLATRRFSSNGQAARAKVEEVLHKGLPLGKDELVKSEMRSLLRGDIPTFSVAGRGLDLMDDMGRVIPSLFSTLAVDNAIRRVDDLSKEGLPFLRSLLYEGFHAYPLREETSVGPVRMRRCDEPLAPGQAIREAEELLDVICDYLIETPTGASGWITYDRALQSMQVMGPGMYDGSTGLGLFASTLAQVTEDERVRTKALACTDVALADVRHLLEAAREGLVPMATIGCGEAGGLGGILRCLALMGEQGRVGCGELASACLGILDNLDASQVAQSDRISGIAGLLSTLCRFDRLRDDPRTRSLVERLASRLVELRTFEADGQTLWQTVSPTRLISGSGHGMAGIAEALHAAGRLLRRDDWIALARQAMLFEDTLFDPELHTWPDRRLFPKRSCMNGCCSGAPGISIMARRIEASELEPMRRNALEALDVVPLPYRDHLCCGCAAVVEAELCAGRPGRAGRILAGTVGRKELVGHYQTTHPGFRHHDRLTLFYGLAGIGYEMLRYARPDLVASVI